jgi:hypothetical protein
MSPNTFFSRSFVPFTVLADALLLLRRALEFIPSPFFGMHKHRERPFKPYSHAERDHRSGCDSDAWKDIVSEIAEILGDPCRRSVVGQFDCGTRN